MLPIRKRFSICVVRFSVTVAKFFTLVTVLVLIYFLATVVLRYCGRSLHRKVYH